MLRDKNLVPLSHQHQHALALCVRLDRALSAGPVDLEAWQSEIQQIFEQEVTVHFTAEEQHVFPPAARFAELQPVVEGLLAQHAVLRDLFARSAKRTLDSEGLRLFVDALSSHIRKEERQLFEAMQKLMSTAELTALGSAVERALAETPSACLLPNQATRLRPR
jgi:hemerythrin-like domain-containing protein